MSDVFPATMPTRIRVMIVVFTLAAIGIFVGAYRANSDPSANNGCNQPPAIELLYPACKTLAFQQAQVGVDMAPGYTVELTVNGVQIPRDQIENRAASNAVDARIVPDLYVFTPGPGKVIERLSPGPNAVIVKYHKLSENEATAVEFPWYFTVS